MKGKPQINDDNLPPAIPFCNSIPTLQFTMAGLSLRHVAKLNKYIFITTPNVFFKF